MIDVTIDHTALPLDKLYELVRHNPRKATVHYTLPATLIEPGMSTADAQDITEAHIDGSNVLFTTITPGFEGTDGRIRPVDERLALATFPDTEHRGGHEFAAAKITAVHLSMRGKPQPAMTATVTFIETLDDGQEIRHEAEYTPEDFPGDGTVFDTAEDFEHYLYNHDEDLWDLVAEDDREGWDGADADGIDLSLHPFDQNIEVCIREHRRQPEPGQDSEGSGPGPSDLGGLTATDIWQAVQILARIADYTEPEDFDDLLNADQLYLMAQISDSLRATKVTKTAGRVTRGLPPLSDQALHHLLKSAGLDPAGRIEPGPRHIDLIVDTAIATGLLPAGSTWDSSPSRLGCRFYSGSGPELALDISDLVWPGYGCGRAPTLVVARHVLTVLLYRLLGTSSLR